MYSLRDLSDSNADSMWILFNSLQALVVAATIICAFCIFVEVVTVFKVGFCLVFLLLDDTISLEEAIDECQFNDVIYDSSLP